MHRFLNMLVRAPFTAYPKSKSLSSSAGTFTVDKLVREQRPKAELLDLPQMTANVLLFGRHHSDHMGVVDYDEKNGWSAPVIKPFERLKINPFVSCLHYGTQCFEGLKAYKNVKGQIRLFRPDCNALRFKKSSMRLSLPDFDGQELVRLIQQFILTEERWIPPISEFSYYIRPLHIATEPSLGVKKPSQSKLLVMGGPVGPYYPTGFKPVSLSCTESSIRSAPLGTGAFKIGGNYAPTLQASYMVLAEGYQQVLWLYENQIVEVGASNIFFIFKDSKSGQIEVVTPELEDLILPGVTRDSILELLRSEKQYKVSERRIFIQEVIERHKKGELLECFGAGTAVIISGVKEIEFMGQKVTILDDKTLIGPISHEIRNKILGIQEGRIPDKFGWVKLLK